MNLSIARTGRSATRLRVGVVATLATAALLAGCSNDSSSDEATTDAPSASASESAASDEVTVISQTNLLLVTAQDTLEGRGLEVEVTDITGQGRTIDDPTQWLVVTQTPETGTVEPGTVVQLEVRKTDDPAS